MQGGAGASAEEAEPEEEVEAEEDAPDDARTLAKRAKIEAVWQALNSRDTGGANALGAAGAPSRGMPLAALCGRATDARLASDLVCEWVDVWGGRLDACLPLPFLVRSFSPEGFSPSAFRGST